MDKNREFQKRIMATFKLEAEENIESVSKLLFALEKAPVFSGNEELFEKLYRSAHSLKGASRAVGIGDVETLCHAFEDVLSAIRNEEIGISSDTIEVFFQTIDLISEVLKYADDEVSSELSKKISDHIDLLTLLEIGKTVELPKTRITNGPQNENSENKEIFDSPDKLDTPEVKVQDTEESVQNKPYSSLNKKNETVRISAKKLDSFLTQVEELLPLKLSAAQQSSDLQRIIGKFVSWKKEMFSEMSELNRPQLKNTNWTKNDKFKDSKNTIIEIEKELHDLQDLAKQEAYQANQKIESLLDDVKELLTVPFSVLLDGFPKMVREISKELGKELEFLVEGDNIEIDRRILDELRIPLTHLLRNSIDYGIETPEERIRKNKNRKGKINIKIEQIENNKISLWISDDGPGLNLEKLKELYVKNEMNGKEIKDEQVSEDEIASYIFKSGVSTSTMVTDISGRGLGMAIVQETIENLGGSIRIETKKDKGTTFQIILPLSIVTFRGVIFESSNQTFIVPTSKVKRIIRIEKNEIKTIKGKPSVVVNDKIVPLYLMSETLGLSFEPDKKSKKIIIVLEVKSNEFGLIIEKIMGEQEILVKKFNKQLTRVPNILGATVLGANKVVPVLNVNDLYLTVEKRLSGSALDSKIDEGEERQRHVLIVEDSITSRTLLKNIVETAGYKTTVAVDGEDGFSKLQKGLFDAVISDVEMPRMNGFELTEKIKSDKNFANIPVILVTSLSKTEHREKGVEVGANAYIVKSSFDGENLLDALERLI